MKKLTMIALLGFVAILFLSTSAIGLSQRERDLMKWLDDFKPMAEINREILPHPRTRTLSFSIKDISEIEIWVKDRFYSEVKIPPYEIEIKFKAPINEIKKLSFPSAKLEDLVIFSTWIKEGKSVSAFVVVEYVGSDKKIKTCFPSCSISNWRFAQ